MKYIFILLVFPLLSASECGKHKKASVSTTEPATEKKEEVKDSIPPCVRKLIEGGNKQEPPESPLQVYEYLYNGKTVYLLNARCCDQYNMLYDDSCRTICAPSGGFTGRGDGKCIDFKDVAKYVRLVWQSPDK